MEDFSFVARRLLDDRGQISIWGASIMKAYEKVAVLKHIPPISWVRPRDYFVLGSRVFGKLSVHGAKNAHLVMSAKDPIRLGRVPTSFSYDLKAYSEIYQAVFTYKFDRLADLAERMSRVIERAKPMVFIANSTIDPINRLWLSRARQHGIRTICLQHGVYGRAIPDYAQEEDIVDRYIALDEIQASIVARNIDPTKIFVLGARERFKWSPPNDALTICFVGEDWERYGFHELKMQLVSRYREIAMALAKGRSIAVCYKPHPSENQFYGINAEMRTISKSELIWPDVFIGFSSSLLRDVSAQGKLAIQIFDGRFNADNFFDNGYCMSLANDASLIESIAELIRKEQDVPCVREQSLESLLQ